MKRILPYQSIESMLKPHTSVWSNDCYNLIDVKQIGKFCKMFIFRIGKCIANFSLIVSGG